MNQSYQLGQVVNTRNSRLIVVRIVKSQSLFETPEGDAYVLDEHYLELRDSNGQASFIRLATNHQPFTGSKGNIRALPPIYYKEDEDG